MWQPVSWPTTKGHLAGPYMRDTNTPDKQLYSRRAAANLLGRIKKNSARMASLDPELRRRVLSGEEGVKSELISALCEIGGDIDALSATFQMETVVSSSSSSNNTTEPMTEKELVQSYGEEGAQKIIAHKRSIGMEQDDPNCPGFKVYLMHKTKRLGVYQEP